MSTTADLEKRALAARDLAYVPYSGYRVGACVEMKGGATFDGANVENASFGLTICAERNAVYRAVLEGHREVSRMVVATESSPPVAPCGMCLQTLCEFAPEPENVRVVLVNPDGQRAEHTLAELFPHGFRGQELKRDG